ncbi:MAG: TrmH family RNA methyltransferase [Alphaproteobacteria bacterium]
MAGLHAGQALFAREPGRIERLFLLPAQRDAAQPILAALSRARRPWREVGEEELARVAGSAMHGGIVAVARPRPVGRFDPAAVAAWAARGRPVLVLDGVSNPHNLGAIARSAAFLGVERVILSAHPAQAMPSDAAYRVAEGGLDLLELLRADDLPAALGRHFRVVATALGRDARPLAEVPRDRPVAIVLGNEERGLGRATLEACAMVARIPGSGLVQSLNVAATAAIAIHHFAQPR